MIDGELAVRSRDRALRTCIGGEGVALLGTGWSFVEPGHVWSEAPIATLRIPAAGTVRRMCRLRGDLVGVVGRTSGVSVSVDGMIAGTFRLDVGGLHAIIIDVDLPPREDAQDSIVTLAFADPVCPADLDGGGDMRQLGIMLQSVALCAPPDPETAPTLRALLAARLAPPAAVAGLVEELAFLYDPLTRDLLRHRRPARIATRGATTMQLRALDRVCALAGLGAVTLAEIGGGDTPSPDTDLLMLCDQARVHARDDTDRLGLADLPGAVDLVANTADPAACPDALFGHCEVTGTPLHMGDAVVVASSGLPVPNLPQHGYGAMIAEHADGALRTAVAAYSATNARTGGTVVMLRDLLHAAQQSVQHLPRVRCIFQYDDVAHRPDLPSLGFSRPIGSTAVALVPDPYFHFSEGYEFLRRAVPSFPAWEERRDIVFWRGTTTHNALRGDGANIQCAAEIPRIAMSLKLLDHPYADVAPCAIWKDTPFAGEAKRLLTEHGLLRDPLPMLEHAAYRYQIDIDGVGNAWSLLERMLTGSCILRIASPLEMWFHARLEPWRHFIPVRRDLADLAQQVAWCRDHDAQCREIAREGQAFALGETFAAARATAVTALLLRCEPIG